MNDKQNGNGGESREINRLDRKTTARVSRWLMDNEVRLLELTPADCKAAIAAEIAVPVTLGCVTDLVAGLGLKLAGQVEPTGEDAVALHKLEITAREISRRVDVLEGLELGRRLDLVEQTLNRIVAGEIVPAVPPKSQRDLLGDRPA